MPSKHARAGLLIKSGLYDNLHSFAELEQRISALGDENTKAVGDAFEIFVEGYLATHQKMQAEAVWLVGQVPLDVRQQLNLPSDTKGIDGVFRARTGTLVPYQVKFRSQRAYLTYTEIAPFLGLTERATDRIVFTNSNELAEDVKNRDAMRTVRGSDFDDLMEDDFKAVSCWLREQPVAIRKLSPRPHQFEALTRISDTLENSDRAHVVMACGTGKTLVGLWATEALQPKTVLVLVPSLTLLQQTLDEWSRHNSWGKDFTYLCVCSDPTVTARDEYDPIQLRATDLDFRVDTNPDEVRRFIDRDTADVKVVLSTYHSSPVVSEGARGLAPFDVAIFDEAHKTTGPKGGLFAHCLSEENIKIRKRLFFTATPRHYDIRHRDREGDFKIQSMDDPRVYGPRAHTLTFGQATQKEIICGYKVVISVVDGEEVNDFALKYGITLVKGDLIGARWVANQIAIERAVERTGARRVITFHSRISTAKEFSSESSHGIRQYLPEFAVYHVNGSQHSSERKQIIRAFREAKKSLITNARCLMEGIDVPAVDMVAFVDPRHSKIDIAQATGRAMRKPPASDKKVGYVVVPLFLEMEQGETLDEALKRSEFDDVADVLNALQEQDEDLVQIVQELKEAKGRGEKFDSHRLSDKIEVLGPTIELTALTSNILVEVVDRIGVSWDEWYGRLKSYKDRFGDCRVPIRHIENGYNLGPWVANQRSAKHKLSTDRRKKLDDLGFVWEPYNEAWEEGFRQLKSYRDHIGHCRVPKKFVENGYNLASWVRNQRYEYAKGRLSPERRKRLDDLGFDWDVLTQNWEEGFGALKSYRDRIGDCRVPYNHRENGFSLGNWVRHQRDPDYPISEERKQRLDEIGFVWDTYLSKWEIGFSHLKSYKDRFGHCRVQRGHIEAGYKLDSWVHVQRRNKNKLSEKQKASLEAIGFDWNVHSTNWEKAFECLKNYKCRNGDCRVPSNYVESGFALGNWVIKQRRNEATLPAERRKRLDDLGFDWNIRISNRGSVNWENGFRHLRAYKERFGDCRVPFNHLENGYKLGRWVFALRQRKNELSEEQIKSLDQLEFDWHPSSHWEKAFASLKIYKDRFGHCRPSKTHIENGIKLGRWVGELRRHKEKLSEEQRKRLDQIGFEWSRKEKRRDNRRSVRQRREAASRDVPDQDAPKGPRGDSGESTGAF